MTNYEHFEEIIEKGENELRRKPLLDRERPLMRIDRARQALKELPVSLAGKEWKDDEDFN